MASRRCLSQPGVRFLRSLDLWWLREDDRRSCLLHLWKVLSSPGEINRWVERQREWREVCLKIWKVGGCRWCECGVSLVGVRLLRRLLDTIIVPKKSGTRRYSNKVSYIRRYQSHVHQFHRPFRQVTQSGLDVNARSWIVWSTILGVVLLSHTAEPRQQLIWNLAVQIYVNMKWCKIVFTEWNWQLMWHFSKWIGYGDVRYRRTGPRPLLDVLATFWYTLEMSVILRIR